MKQSAIALLIWACLSCNDTQQKTPVKPAVEASAPLSELKFLTRKVSFGVVPSDTLLTARYDFVNSGPNELIIYGINPDCTCTNFKLSKDHIKPNDSAYILLTLSTKNKIGEVKLYSTISANTPSKLYSIQLNATVN